MFVLGGSIGSTTIVLTDRKTTAAISIQSESCPGENVYRGSRGGSCRPERDFPIFLRWLQEGKLDLERLVTRRFQLEEINEATEALEHGEILGRAIIDLPQ